MHNMFVVLSGNARRVRSILLMLCTVHCLSSGIDEALKEMLRIEPRTAGCEAQTLLHKRVFVVQV